MDQNIYSKKNKEDIYLTFKLANEEYGIDILKVKEIIGLMPITVLPQTPEFVKGVINLRGRVIPVMDLRLRFGMEPMRYTDRTCIIVLEVQNVQMEKCWEVKNCGKIECPAYENRDRRCWIISGTYCRDEIQGSFREKIEACRGCDFYKNAHKQRSVNTLGVVVDSVSEVLNVKTEEIEDVPNLGTQISTEYITGMAKADESVKILLDIDQILGREESAYLMSHSITESAL